MADTEETQFTVGTRCVCEGYYGTICYIGEVPPTSGKRLFICIILIVHFTMISTLVLT